MRRPDVRDEQSALFHLHRAVRARVDEIGKGGLIMTRWRRTGAASWAARLPDAARRPNSG